MMEQGAAIKLPLNLVNGHPIPWNVEEGFKSTFTAQVFEWYERFKNDQECLSDEEQLRRPKLANSD